MERHEIIGFCAKADRAKLFAPFDALEGFREALAQESAAPPPSFELSEEKKEEFDRILRQAPPSSSITVIYYENGALATMRGPLRNVCLPERRLTVGHTSIPMDAVRDIRTDT